MKPAILAYWDIRGLAQPIRLMLEYVQLHWEDKLYVCGEAPKYDKSCWFDVKSSLGLDFPNLPYFDDGKVKLTQSSAIMRYIARKFGLEGSNEEEKTKIDLICAEIEDFRNNFTRTCYNPDFEDLKGPYLEALPEKLKKFSNFLGSNLFLAGENISFVDFMMYEMLDQHLFLLLDPEYLKPFQNLESYYERIGNLEPIANYIKSPRFIKYPLNNRMAKFGG